MDVPSPERTCVALGLFFRCAPVKHKSQKLVPIFIGGGVMALAALFLALTHRYPAFDLFQRLEWMTYDWRVRAARQHPLPNAPNLGFVEIRDESIQAVQNGALGYQAGLYWPRHVYGRLVEELSRQGATAIGFDVLFTDLRRDLQPAVLPDGTEEMSDYFFARQLAAAGNVILAADKGALPIELFRTNAWAAGDVAAKRESDGILRRAMAFEDYFDWNPLIRQAAQNWNCDLQLARVEPGRIILTGRGQPEKIIPLDSGDNFNQAILWEAVTGQKPGGHVQPMKKAFVRRRIWDMGITVAAHALQLDLANAVIEPRNQQIILRGPGGVERRLPIDDAGRFYIDWSLTPSDPMLMKEPVESLLYEEVKRRNHEPLTDTNRWRGKLAFVGSTASGNDLSDVGATPLEKETYLTGRFLNVANSVLTGRFIRAPAVSTELGLIFLLALAAGLLVWALRDFWAVLSVGVLLAAYFALGLYLYVQSRYWLPLILPSVGAGLTLLSLVTYRAFFEKSERRHVKEVFAKLVSPNVVHELLKAEKLSLGGARRQVTVLFSDVRGFTEMTDESQARAEEYVRQHKLSDAEADAYFNEQSQEVLRTVNLYLGTLADVVKTHEGTLDKYIGDCVMAFWGAPTPNEKHALTCVRAAIDSQRAIYALNQKRAVENKQREQENAHSAAQNQPPQPLLKLLSLGTGINTGVVTVGLMGSEQHTFNYTVFGREVNLASRLEGSSGRGRIFIGEATYLELLQDDHELAAACLEQAPTTLKGFRNPVKTFEVPWKQTKPAAAGPPMPQAGAA